MIDELNIEDGDYNVLIVGKWEDKQFKTYHLVIYPNKPTMNDVESLRYELQHDEEFGLSEIIPSLEINSTIMHVKNKKFTFDGIS